MTKPTIYVGDFVKFINTTEDNKDSVYEVFFKRAQIDTGPLGDWPAAFELQLRPLDLSAQCIWAYENEVEHIQYDESL